MYTFQSISTNCNRFNQANLIIKLWFKATINFIGKLVYDRATIFFIAEK